MEVASNSSSKWLDRLRKSKNFPANSDQNLDHFLTHQNTHFPIPPIPIVKNPKPNPNSANPELSSVLYNLFNFGESDENPQLFTKKGIRKQKKPRFCVVSNNCGLGENNEVFKLTREENNGNGDEFVGFSKTNVTVIDTSYPWWKCERVVFRKKNLWRVRDRKCKSTNGGDKKRKARISEDENGGLKKMLKVCGSSNEGSKQNEKTNKNPAASPETLSQVQNQRFPRKSKKGGSDGVLIKRTTSKKKGLAPLKD